MLQPVVERKGCEKVMGEMRDCLVETHCWGKCDEEVQRFQECINTKYFEEIVAEPEVKADEDILEPEEVVTVDEVKSEGDVVTSDENGEQVIDENVKIKEEEPEPIEEIKEDDMFGSNVEADSFQDEKPEEQPEKPQEQSEDTDANAKVADDKDVEASDDSKADEVDNVDKDSFRIKIVSKSEKEVEEDENLLFKVSVKPNVSA